MNERIRVADQGFQGWLGHGAMRGGAGAPATGREKAFGTRPRAWEPPGLASKAAGGKHA